MHEPERRSQAYYDRRARFYDWANKVAAFLRGASPTRERRKAVRRLRLKPGDRVLEVSVGTGTNLPLIAPQIGPSGWLVGLDISPGMLGVCDRKLTGLGIAAALVEGEAAHLPYADASFDAVFHHGGLAEFGDKATAIAEMFRVARSGGRVVICDVGVPQDGRVSLVNRFLLRLQPAYNHPPPMHLLPPSAREVRLGWYFRGSWYMIESTKA
jgi:ubiquinone/menaquinone biosynthesis C-methylase UbiE